MSGRALLGTIAALVGLGLLLEQAGVVDFGAVASTWWPLILVTVGAVKLATGTRIGGLVLVVAGALFQADALQLLPRDFFNYFWPVALIVVGAWLIVSRGRSAPHVASDDFIRQFVIFGGLEARNESQRLEGGTLTALFGGIELDLRGAKIAGERAVLEVTAMFGGVDIRVPKEWRVVASGTPLLGGWENKSEHREREGEPTPTLELKGIAMLGGVEIGN